MATYAVGVSAILGIVTGSLCARNEISAKFILGVCDFFALSWVPKPIPNR